MSQEPTQAENSTSSQTDPGFFSTVISLGAGVFGDSFKWQLQEYGYGWHFRAEHREKMEVKYRLVRSLWLWDSLGKEKDAALLDHWIEIDKTLAQKWMKRFSKVAVTPFPSDPGRGVDGADYSCIVSRQRGSSEFSWWCEAPPEWQKLEKAFHLTVKEFEKAFPRDCEGNPV